MQKLDIATNKRKENERMDICKYQEHPFGICKLDNTLCDRRLSTLVGNCSKLTEKVAATAMPKQAEPKPARDAKGHFVKREAK